MEERIDNLVSLTVIDEKIRCLGTRTGVPRLGVQKFRSSERIHGVVQRDAKQRKLAPIPTTQFPQSRRMGERWDRSDSSGGWYGGLRGTLYHPDRKVRSPDSNIVRSSIRSCERPSLGRSSSSDFDQRLFWEYYSVPFRMGFLEGGAKGVMAD